MAENRFFPFQIEEFPKIFIDLPREHVINNLQISGKKWLMRTNPKYPGVISFDTWDHNGTLKSGRYALIAHENGDLNWVRATTDEELLKYKTLAAVNKCLATIPSQVNKLITRIDLDHGLRENSLLIPTPKATPYEGFQSDIERAAEAYRTEMNQKR